jgi:hypothetical protein
MENLDLFGSIVGLTYKNGHRYRSKVGGALSLFVFAVCFAMVIFYGKKFLDRDYPSMTIEEVKYGDPQEISTDDLKLVVMMKYFGRNEFHMDVFKPEVFHRSMNYSSGILTERKLDQVNCTSSLFPGSESEFNKLELNKGLCVDLKNTSIRGSSLNDQYDYIAVKFSMCLDEEGCMSSEELPDYIRNAKPVGIIYFHDTIFQPKNKDQFVKKFINNFDVLMTFDDFKFSNVYLSQNEMNIEKGYFIASNIEVISETAFDSFRDSVSVRTPDQKESLTINVMSSKRSQVVNIRYMQLSELIANICAITGNIFVFLTYFTSILNQALFEKDLFEALVSVRQEIRKKNEDPIEAYDNKVTLRRKSINFQPSSPSKRMSNHNPSNSENFEILSGKIADKNNKLPDVMSSPSLILPTSPIKKNPNNMLRRHFKFSKAEYLFMKLGICKFFNKRVFILKKLEFKMHEKFSFLNVLRKLQEFELIKFLLFEKKQLQMLRHVKRPEMVINTFSEVVTRDEFSLYYFDDRNSLFQRKNNLKTYADAKTLEEYKRMKKRGSTGNVPNNSLDNKILECIDIPEK